MAEQRQLEFTTTPSDLQPAQELFGALENWAADFAPPTWMRLWWIFRVVSVFVIMPGLIFGLLGVPNQNAARRDDSYHQEAHKLLRDGINENNQRKAIELLLAITSNYAPDNSTSGWKPGRTYWRIFGASAVGLVMLSFSPSIVIGVWSGKRKLARWRLWMQFCWSVPVLVFTTILWPQILRMLGLSP